MAVPKKGWRRITVGNETYSWRAIGTDSGIDVVVVTDAAFVRATKAQRLLFRLDYDHLKSPRPGGAVAFRQRAVVAPGVVRRAIHVARGLSSPFTGETGVPDVVLSREELALLQAAARSRSP
jgi:hypothetical protein